MPFEIPIFPLNVVLFPSMQLPLHIFEPRYRRMIARCLEEQGHFGVALLIGGEEGQAGTIPAPVGCTARIITHSGFPDGRFNITAQGERRFRILALQERDEVWIGTCEWLDDEDGEDVGEADELALTRQVRGVLQRYLRSLIRDGQLNVRLEELKVPASPYALSMWIASLIALSNETRQELLCLTSTRQRLQVESHWLQRGEVVQRAFARKLQQHTADAGDEDIADALSPFLSLN